jgi:hypothetical protein
MRNLKMILLITTILAGCKKPYNPPAISVTNNYLVIEGVINSGPDSTVIKLSRTVNLSSAVTVNPVLHAILTVESDQNNSYALTETAKGNYVSAGLGLDNSRQYRLRIKTPDNRQYLSDFVPVKVTPPIDSIGFNITSVGDTGIQIYANTHDPNNNTHYYRWDYDETWRFHSLYTSYYYSIGVPVPVTYFPLRTAAQRVDSCFGNDVASNIVLGSSAKLTQDVIYQAPIINIPSTSEKIETKYSILVRQYALTSGAYTFWQNLKTNTEKLGSIFDAQPSQIDGNIHNINNAAEPVIGYLSVCTVQTKRVFIRRAQLPLSWETVYPYTCGIDSNYFSNPRDGRNDVQLSLLRIPNSNIPLYPMYTGNSVIGFFSAPIDCADCTIRGATQKPAFWK